MAKHNGIVVRIGAAHDEVRVQQRGAKAIVFDRSAMRRDNTKERGQKLVRALNTEVVDTWSEMNGFHTDGKDKRRVRKQHQNRDKAKREHA